MKQLYAIYFLLSLAVLFAASSCTASLTDDPDTTARAIAFGTPQAGTRAAVNSSAVMGGFSVWGWYGEDGANSYNVFDGETVSRSGNSWGYTGGIRYWIPGKMYNFYAVYPADLKASVDASGTITINDFDCSKTGSEAVDLMTATAPGLKGSDAPMVGLTFNHELAKIKFQAKTQGSKVTITSFKINGVSYAGDFSHQFSSGSAQWTPKSVAVAGDEIFYVTDMTIENTTDERITDLLGDLLILPQQLEASKQQLTISYRYDGEMTDRGKTIDLRIENGIIGWTASQSYIYTLDLRTTSLTLDVTIQDWTKENADVSWKPSK